MAIFSYKNCISEIREEKFEYLSELNDKKKQTANRHINHAKSPGAAISGTGKNANTKTNRLIARMFFLLMFRVSPHQSNSRLINYNCKS